jgi:hypothetical protein
MTKTPLCTILILFYTVLSAAASDYKVILELGPLEGASIKRERHYIAIVRKSSD